MPRILYAYGLGAVDNRTQPAPAPAARAPATGGSGWCGYAAVRTDVIVCACQQPRCRFLPPRRTGRGATSTGWRRRPCARPRSPVAVAVAAAVAVAVAAAAAVAVAVAVAAAAAAAVAVVLHPTTALPAPSRPRSTAREPPTAARCVPPAAQLRATTRAPRPAMAWCSRRPPVFGARFGGPVRQRPGRAARPDRPPPRPGAGDAALA